jgi:hypothetical protein
VIPPYATVLMSGDSRDLADVAGERGNPWVMPWNPGYIKIKQERWGGGYGLCGWAQPYLTRTTAEVWFAFSRQPHGI